MYSQSTPCAGATETTMQKSRPAATLLARVEAAVLTEFDKTLTVLLEKVQRPFTRDLCGMNLHQEIPLRGVEGSGEEPAVLK